jgi:hypothetical protein
LNDIIEFIFRGERAILDIVQILFPTSRSVFHNKELVVIDHIGLVIFVLCKDLEHFKLSFIYLFDVSFQVFLSCGNAFIGTTNINQIDFLLFSWEEVTGNIN